VLVELGRATGQVEHRDGAGAQHLEHQVDGGTVHHLGAVRPGIHVAMQTTLVAFVAEVDLQGAELRPGDRREIGLGEQVEGGVHG
jgi:hypothetical protein